MKVIRTQPTLNLMLPSRIENNLARGKLDQTSPEMPSQASFIQRVASDDLLYPESPQCIKGIMSAEPASSQTPTLAPERMNHYQFQSRMACLLPNQQQPLSDDDDIDADDDIEEKREIEVSSASRTVASSVSSVDREKLETRLQEIQKKFLTNQYVINSSNDKKSRFQYQTIASQVEDQPQLHKQLRKARKNQDQQEFFGAVCYYAEASALIGIEEDKVSSATQIQYECLLYCWLSTAQCYLKMNEVSQSLELIEKVLHQEPLCQEALILKCKAILSVPKTLSNKNLEKLKQIQCDSNIQQVRQHLKELEHQQNQKLDVNKTSGTPMNEISTDISGSINSGMNLFQAIESKNRTKVADKAVKSLSNFLRFQIPETSFSGPQSNEAQEMHNLVPSTSLAQNRQDFLHRFAGVLARKFNRNQLVLICFCMLMMLFALTKICITSKTLSKVRTAVLRLIQKIFKAMKQ